MKALSITDLTTALPTQTAAPCVSCASRAACLPANLLDQPDKMNALTGVIETSVLDDGEVFAQQGQPFESVFIVKSGSAKVSHRNSCGDAVIGFYFAPELIGIDAIALGSYPSSAEALERSEICRINFSALKTLTQTTPELSERFCNMVSDAMASYIKCSLLTPRVPAAERLAGFLLYVAHANNPELSPQNRSFNLPMSKKDIANYLGVTNETLSRSFAYLVDRGIISVEGKTLKILCLEKIFALASQRGHSLSFGNGANAITHGGLAPKN